MNFKRLLFFVLFGFVTTQLFSQKISGKVTTQQNEPLQGATIRLSPSGKMTKTNAEGNFEIASANDQSVTVTYVGYISQTVAISSSPILIQLVQDVSQLSEVVLVGNRHTQRSQYNSIAPVDVVRLSDAKVQMPQYGVNEVLNLLVPSFNAQRQSASDGTEHIDPASLRGLGPDQVLVLINGKRRHTTSLINYQNTVGNGSVGTDMNAIPSSAIDRIEVLHDGASAQYGSDAIAGVINIILKKNAGLTGSFTSGISSRGDGGLINGNVNYGVNFKDKGYLNLTLEASQRGATNRTQNHDLIIFDQSSLNNYFAYAFANDSAASRAYDDTQLKAKGLKRNDFNFHIGDAKINNYQSFANFGYDISSKAQLYAFGGVSLRNGTGFGFRRLPSETNHVVTSLFPLGFQPHLNSSIVDFSVAVGVLQQLGNDWNLDISNTIGRNSFKYTVNNTDNSSMGNQSPTSFYAGNHAFLQNTANVDLSKTFDKNKTVINFGVGAEFRHEHYAIHAGDDPSWKLYNINPNGTAGAQSFPGFTPDNAVQAGRSSVALYTDADFNFNKQFLLALAARFENYSDFGSTLNGKVSARYNFSEYIALRGAVSTGFRAPSLQQQYFSYFYSDISDSGIGISNKGIFPINSPVTKALGLPPLKQETSINYSAGFTTRPAKNLYFTVDAYLIDINNRIVITSPIKDPRITALGAEDGRFFTNAIDTRTKGLDIVAGYTVPFSRKTKLDVSLAMNFNRTKITSYHFPSGIKVNGLTQDNYFGPDQQSLIETNNPSAKHTLSLSLITGRFNFTVRDVYWGKVTRNGYPFGVAQTHKPKITTDPSVTYTIKKGITITAGANNVFDVFPDLQVYPNSYFGVFKYAPVQMGVLGAFYYARLNIAIK